jgi:hypothetical protein
MKLSKFKDYCAEHNLSWSRIRKQDKQERDARDSE